MRRLRKWRSAVELLRSAEFIVASRPGFSLRDVARALPEELRPDEAGARRLLESGSLETNGATIHLLPDVNEEVSATEIREAARRRRGLEKLVPRARGRIHHQAEDLRRGRRAGIAGAAQVVSRRSAGRLRMQRGVNAGLHPEAEGQHNNSIHAEN